MYDVSEEIIITCLDAFAVGEEPYFQIQQPPLPTRRNGSVHFHAKYQQELGGQEREVGQVPLAEELNKGWKAEP